MVFAHDHTLENVSYSANRRSLEPSFVSTDHRLSNSLRGLFDNFCSSCSVGMDMMNIAPPDIIFLLFGSFVVYYNECEHHKTNVFKHALVH